VRVLLTNPTGSGMCQLEEIIAGTAAALPCSQRLTLVKAVKIFLQLSSPLSSHPRLNLSSLLLPPLPFVPAGSALSPAGLCRGAAPEHSCLSAALPTCHELPPCQEPSSAQQQRTSPRHPKGRDSAESVEAFHHVFLFPAFAGDSAPSHACHKPSGVGVPLASVQVCTKQTPVCECDRDGRQV